MQQPATCIDEFPRFIGRIVSVTRAGVCVCVRQQQQNTESVNKLDGFGRNSQTRSSKRNAEPLWFSAANKMLYSNFEHFN